MKQELFNKNVFSNILITLFGVVFFVSSEFNWLASNPRLIVSNVTIEFVAFLGSLFSVSLFFWMRTLVRSMLQRSSLPDSVKKSHQRYDAYAFAAFLLPLFGVFGIQFTPTAGTVMILIFLSAQCSIVYLLMDTRHKQEIFSSAGWLSFLFLISGFAALIYQIVWQRSLFTAFGVNIESITIIVSIFMFGLGLGALIGGVLSKRFPSVLPHLFVIFEVIIGTFGIVSLPLISAVSNAPLHNSLFMVSVATFGLLCIPTIFMGATLPVLVTYLHRRYKNIGKSVGTLYFINTVGSAIACFVTVDILFTFFGKLTSVIVAALCNFIVGVLVFRYTQMTKNGPETELQNTTARVVTEGGIGQRGSVLRFSLVLLLSSLTGYISLSQEILWFRALSYTTGGSPDVFAYVLGFFLFGIAFGALFAKKVCEREKDYTLLFIALMLVISSVVYYVSMPVIGQLLTYSRPLGMYASYLLVGIISSLTGGIFPVLCHFGIRSKTSVGFSLSWIYFANIIGSTAGPLLTGFVLMNFFPLQQNVLYLSLLTLASSGIVWCCSPISPLPKTAIIGGIILGIAGMFFINDGMYSEVLEKLHFKNQGRHYKYVVQNRSGIIAVESGPTDTIYGGGVYDGKFNTDPVLNSNIITRAYMIAALHPNPKDVLQIGLSSGSWARVIANHSDVEKLTVVEINPGYLNIVRKYPEIATVLDDPKVTIHVDDGRRWLNRNPDERFDIIVLPLSLHWRDGATNLLSEEFMRLCKKHLKKGGIVYCNTNLLEDIPFTASRLFKHVTRFSSFIAASDSPFLMTMEEKRQNLGKFQNAGKPVFHNHSVALRGVLGLLVASDLTDRADEFRERRGLWLITDDNMATEFKITSRWFNPNAAWGNLFKTF